MKLTDIITLTEGKRLPDVEYKEKKVKDKVERITLELTGKHSEKFTKLASKFKEVKESLEELTDVKNEMNEHIKAEALELFDAEDEILTRVIETVSMTVTISKKTVEEKSKTDYEKAIKMLSEMVPELTDKINDVIKACTEVTKNEKSPALRVDIKEDMSDIINMAKKKFLSLYKKIKSWMNSFDSKLKAVKKLAEI